MNKKAPNGWFTPFVLGILLLVSGCENPNHQAKEQLMEEITQRQASWGESMDLYHDAVAEIQADHPEKAYELLRKSVAVNNRNASAWVSLGMLEYDKNDFFEAARAMNEALRLEPSRFEAHYNLGVIYETAGKYTQAIRRYERALEIAADEPIVMENLIRCYIKTKQEMQRTLELIDRALLTERRAEWKDWLVMKKTALQSEG